MQCSEEKLDLIQQRIKLKFEQDIIEETNYHVLNEY